MNDSIFNFQNILHHLLPYYSEKISSFLLSWVYSKNNTSYTGSGIL